MSKCNCEWCVKVYPALAWMRDHAPEEHYTALSDALQHREVVEIDEGMYRLKCAEVERLRELCAARPAFSVHVAGEVAAWLREIDKAAGRGEGK